MRLSLTTVILLPESTRICIGFPQFSTITSQSFPQTSKSIHQQPKFTKSVKMFWASYILSWHTKCYRAWQNFGKASSNDLFIHILQPNCLIQPYTGIRKCPFWMKGGQYHTRYAKLETNMLTKASLWQPYWSTWVKHLIPSVMISWWWSYMYAYGVRGVELDWFTATSGEENNVL